jgi:hypothetical protein
MANVGGGAAHVEADDLIKAGHLGGLDGADHAACRAGQDRVLALEQSAAVSPPDDIMNISRQPVPSTPSSLGDLVHIAARIGER